MCTSRNSCACKCLRKEATMGCPKVMLGTKWPSITSRCNRSAPSANNCAHSSDNKARSASRMLGAMSTSGRRVRVLVGQVVGLVVCPSLCAPVESIPICSAIELLYRHNSRARIEYMDKLKPHGRTSKGPRG